VKLDKAALTTALKNWPAHFRIAVIFGPDEALVRERAEKISKQVVSDINDPFNVVELSDHDIISDPARLADEASSLSMMGGRRLVRVSGDNLQDALANALAQPGGDSMIVATAGDLKKDNKLRKWAEGAPDTVAAIICYADNPATLAVLLRDEARAAGFALEDEAAQLILAASGYERDVARRELEKIQLYVGSASRTITATDVQAISADRGASGFDGLITALMADDGRKADQQIDRLANEGVAGIGQMNAVVRRLWMMLAAHAQLNDGGNIDEIAQRNFGPMAWKEKPVFRGQLDRWNPARVERGLARMLAADRAAKLSGVKDSDIVAGQAMLGLVRRR
jgi:DNA polymerase III subunit delta